METIGPTARPIRTQKAFEVLRFRSTELLARTRQLIILCDGRHTYAELCDIMGDHIASTRLPSLLEQGLVTLASDVVTVRDSPDDYLSNRMLGNARRYLLDRLDLLPQASAVVYRRHLAKQREPEAIFSHMLITLQWMTRMLPATYMARVHDHLEEIMPERYIARYLNVRADLAAEQG